MGIFGPKSERQIALKHLAKGGVPKCTVPGYTHYKAKTPDGTEYLGTAMVIGPGKNDRDKFWRKHFDLD